MPQLHGGHRHLLDRRAAVGPVGVGVAVAAQRVADLATAGGEGAGVLLLEAGQACGHLAAHRLGDHGAGAGSDAGQVGQGPCLGPGRHVVGVERQDHRGRLAERLHPPGLLAAALHEEGDPAQRGDRSCRVLLRHAPTLLSSTARSAAHCRWSAGGARVPPGRVPHRLVPRRAGLVPSPMACRAHLVHSFVHRGGQRRVDRGAARPPSVARRRGRTAGPRDVRWGRQAWSGRPCGLFFVVRRRCAAVPVGSAPLEDRRPLLAAGADALLQVLGRQRHRLGQRLPLQGALEVGVAAVGQRDLGEPGGDRRRRGDPLGGPRAPRRRRTPRRSRRETRPMRSASSASTTRPVSSRSRAWAAPTTLGQQVGRRPCRRASRA